MIPLQSMSEWTSFDSGNVETTWHRQIRPTLRSCDGLSGLRSFPWDQYEITVEVSPLLPASNTNWIISYNPSRIPLIHIPSDVLEGVWKGCVRHHYPGHHYGNRRGKCINCYFMERLGQCRVQLIWPGSREKLVKTWPQHNHHSSTTMVAHTSIQELLELETPGQLFKPGRSGASEMSGESQA